MTVAVVVKVFDGIVLATDSATTFQLEGGGAQVYNNANKIFHLHRRLPIAAMTWGLGSIGSASIATLAKDLRRRLMGQDPEHADWELPDDWTVKQVAERVVEMFYDELFLTEFPDEADPPVSPLGLLVAGYSTGERQAEAWQLTLLKANDRPTLVQTVTIADYGWMSFAQPEATERLFYGIDPSLYSQLKSTLDGQAWASIEPILQSAWRMPVASAMPFPDAIDLAKFLVEVTAQYSHLLMGPDTVGGVVEVAGINRHEGFRWVNRKHYYPSDLNPWGPSHDE
jgi:hypothetical protein